MALKGSVKMGFGDSSPEDLFADITFLGKKDEQITRELFTYCADRGYVACIDYSDKWGYWVFHTLYRLKDFWVFEKNVAGEFKEKRALQVTGERDIEEHLIGRLGRQEGLAIQRQVKCRIGVADVVTDDAVYEVKLTLTKQALFMALGQVLLYRQVINPDLRAVVVGKPSEGIRSLLPHVAQLGVEIMFWEEESP